MLALARWKIEAAFPCSPVISAADAVEETHSVEHLYEKLAGRPWIEPSYSDYFTCLDGFSLLKVEAIRYYLPGFLLAALDLRDTEGMVGGYIVRTFGGERSEYTIERSRLVLRLLSGEQKVAFALFFATFVVRFGYDKSVYDCFREIGRVSGDGEGFPDFSEHTGEN